MDMWYRGICFTRTVSVQKSAVWYSAKWIIFVKWYRRGLCMWSVYKVVLVNIQIMTCFFFFLIFFWLVPFGVTTTYHHPPSHSIPSALYCHTNLLHVLLYHIHQSLYLLIFSVFLCEFLHMRFSSIFNIFCPPYIHNPSSSTKSLENRCRNQVNKWLLGAYVSLWCLTIPLWIAKFWDL